MSRDKQTEIREMAKVIHMAEVDFVKQRVKCIEQDADFPYETKAQYQADALISAGYRKSTDLAEEIFAEIDRMIYKVLNDRHYIMGDMCYEVAELKKKYIGEDTNVPTNTEGK